MSKAITYLPRIADKLLADKLATRPAVVIRGAKWCGKTETAKQQAKSALYMQDPDFYEQNMLAAELRPSSLLDGAKPRLLDEWQMAPQVWDAVRFSIDRSPGPGQFILTGSSTPGTSPRHSGTGRFSYLTMRPMSLYESGESDGTVSLRALFDGAATLGGSSSLTVDDYAYLVARGGWPLSVVLGDERASLETAKDYIEAICEQDITRLDGIERNPLKVRALLRSYSRHIATSASDAAIQEDVRASGEALSPPTLANYLSALSRLYVVEDLPAWNPALRSRTAIRTSPTRHLVDPSLAVAALGASPGQLLADLETFGLLFESLCIRDLRIYAEAIGGSVYHYRDKTGLEADAVVVLPDARWGIIEVKLGKARIGQGLDSLERLAGKVDDQVMGRPAFKLLLSTGNYPYLTGDGTLVAPLGCLGL